MAASSSPIAATGRRKTAVVRLNLTQGSGKIQVNGRDFEDYFTTAAMRMEAMSPLNLINRAKNFDLIAKASGGGLCGQAGAMKLALARCLIVLESELRPALKKAGYLRRDPRMKERKKSGQPGARKRFQFSKR